MLADRLQALRVDLCLVIKTQIMKLRDENFKPGWGDRSDTSKLGFGQQRGNANQPLNQYTQQPKQEQNNSPFYKSSAPSISLPKGGGALKGIDEKFSVNAVNGTAGMQIPLPLTPGRGGFTPALSLSYSSGSGNSEFGLGWGLSLPAIQRKTDKKLPLYDDKDESDIFLLAGAEDLIPELDGSGKRIIIPSGDYTIKPYRPRIEGLFARIELIQKSGKTESWWRVTTKDNITTWYGLTEEGRIANPESTQQIFKWFPELVTDHKGNLQRYRYKQENDTGVPKSLHEKNRLNNGPAKFTNTYLKSIQYCNKTPWPTDATDHYDPSTGLPSNSDFLMEAVLDYGDHIVEFTAEADHDWPCRTDAFSDYHAGFEIRTYRKCKRVLMFHYFDELDGKNLVRSLELTYAQDGGTATLTEADFITTATQRGYEYRNSAWRSDTLPAMTFNYEPLQWNTNVQSVGKADFQGAPQGLTGPYQWTDFEGEGISGILTEQGTGWFYKSNLGDGHFAPAKAIAQKPSFHGLGKALQWQDLDADGRRQVVADAPVKGFWELNDQQQWENFKAFPNNLNIDWNSPFTKMLDLNGDGKADVLVTEDRAWTWYANEGKEGFLRGGTSPVFNNEEHGPVLLLRDKVQSIFLADMTGDGMTDLVRIKNGEVCYWPNKGYGKFGAKVSMTNAPSFHYSDQFNPMYLSLADISGTGAADLIFIGKNNKCTTWLNLSGNGWSAAKEISVLPATDPQSKIAVLDFLGNGTGCIVWSSPLPQHANAPLRYIDLMGGKKPYLMTSYSNGMGKTVSVTYKSSTQFYLADKLVGKSWATKLPFPVHCIETISTHDDVSDTTFTQTYKYRHGYYDHEEREFRGFGYVETLDTDRALIDGANEPEESRVYLNQSPVLTKTWYHTGAWLRDKTLLDAFKKEYYRFAGWDELATQASFQSGLSAQEQREAYRALKGSALRQEVYALDGNTIKERIPYSVTVNSYQVNRVQKLRKNRFASFLIYSDQTLAYSCERQPADARVAQTLALTVDAYGNVLKSVQIAYPRKTTGAGLPIKVQQEQAKMQVICTQTTMTGDIIDPINYRLRVPWEVKTSEITGLAVPSGLWTVASFKDAIASISPLDFSKEPTAGLVQQRILSHTLTRFANDTNLSAWLNDGTLSALAIPYEQYSLAYTADTFKACYGEDAIAVDLLGPHLTDPNKGSGYKDLYNDGNWWARSGTVQYGATAAARFYTPVSFTDPWGNLTTTEDWNSNAGQTNYWLLPQSVTDAKGNSSSVAAYDWRNLQPIEMKDANNNISRICYDVLGMPVATAIMGKGDEADYLELLNDEAALIPGIPGDLSADSTAQAAFWSATNATAIETAAKVLLGKATWRCIYNLDVQPTAVAMIAREQHYKDNDDSKVIIRVSYTDGFGRIAMHKEQFADGPVTPGGPDVIRWIGSGKTIYNNKGKEVMQFEPYFSPSHQYDDTEAAAEIGISPHIFYDPLGRAYKTELPDGTYSFTTWDNWTQVVYDANDTVELPGSLVGSNEATVNSRWFDAYSNGSTEEQLAADRALAHANTPTVIYMDTLARPFFTMQLLEPGLSVHAPVSAIRSYVNLDIQGNRLSIVDGVRIHEYPADDTMLTLQYKYNLLQSVCWQHSIDGGTGKMITDAAGQPFCHWDAADRFFSIIYDPLRRPVEQSVTDDVGTSISGRTVYADGPSADATKNLRGQVLESYDGGGKHYVEAYDFKGLPVTSYTKMIRDYTITDPDWDQAIVLSSDTFTTSIIVDALGRPITSTDAGNNITRHVYDKGGLLKAVYLKPADPTKAEALYVQDIHYNAKGQRQAIWYGNGTKTSYSYDPLNYRLSKLCTVNLNTSPHQVVQQLQYWYDAVGNIIQITDEAQPTVFYSNSMIRPEQTYTYDPLYRLIQATGRELASNTSFTTGDNYNDASLMFNSTSPFDGEALRNYTQTYTYDAVGNILSLHHNAGVGSTLFTYTRDFVYTANSNRLVQTAVGSQDYDYSHDARGNITEMPHLQSMDWNSQNQLSHVGRDGSMDAYYQYGGGQRVRKVVEKTSQMEERIYLGSFEIYRRYDNNASTPTIERTTVHISDDTGRIAMLEVRTVGSQMDDNDTPGMLKRFIYSNHLQSSGLELDETGAVISYEEYHPYGTTAYQANNSTIKATAKRYRFTGKERDEESGFNYHGARYYASWLCRWISVDPLESKYAPWSSYNYVLCSPLMDTDMSGMGGDNEKKVTTYFINRDTGKMLGTIDSYVENEDPKNITFPDQGINIRSIDQNDWIGVMANGDDINDSNKFNVPTVTFDLNKIKSDITTAVNKNTPKDAYIESYKEQGLMIVFDPENNKITSIPLPDKGNDEETTKFADYTKAGESWKVQYSKVYAPSEWNKPSGARERPSFLLVLGMHTHPKRQNKTRHDGSQGQTRGGSYMEYLEKHSKEDFQLAASSNVYHYIVDVENVDTYTGKGFDDMPVRALSSQSKYKSDFVSNVRYKDFIDNLAVNLINAFKMMSNDASQRPAINVKK
jgi:RHS repeat-associated protein